LQSYKSYLDTNDSIDLVSNNFIPCTLLYLFLLLLYWGTFFKVLVMHHSWIHPLHHPPLSSSLHSWNSFNRCHFSIFIHVYIIFPPYSPPTPFPFLFPPPTGVPTPRQDLLYLPVLHFWKKAFLFVSDSYTGSFIVIFPYINVL
jgi:hypothetical protein